MGEDRSQAFAGVSIPDAYERFVRRQLFDPWARELLARADLGSASSVLDVACGPGTAARVAAGQLGESGKVTATDISAGMLAVAAAQPAEPGAAPIEYIECPADALAIADESFDVALCQQGLQFFADRATALAEMRRCLVPRGLVLISTWAAERPLGLFGPISETMGELGLTEPFPRAFDPASYAMGAPEILALMQAAGLRDVTVETVELDCTWASAHDALATVMGTPFGPLVAELPAERQRELHSRLLQKLGDPPGEVTVKTASNIARASR